MQPSAAPRLPSAQQSPATDGKARRRPAPITTLHEVEKVLELAALFGLYSLIAAAQSKLGVNAHHLDTALDRALPLWVTWVHPYVTMWVFLLAPFVYTRTNRYFRRLCAGFVFALLFAYVVYLIFPTTDVLRPTLPVAHDFSTWLLGLVYASDPPFNCFPSMHVTLSQLAARGVSEIDPRPGRLMGRLAWALAIAIAVSTVLVKQHYVADVVAGTALAWGAHRVAFGRFARRHPPGEDDRRDPRALLVPVGLQLLGVLALFIAYKVQTG